MFDGVLTGSTTTASEAVIHGIPTLLISKAERGFLDEITQRFPKKLFHWKSTKKEGFDEIIDRWLNSIQEDIDRNLEIYATRYELEEIIGPFKGLE